MDLKTKLENTLREWGYVTSEPEWMFEPDDVEGKISTLRSEMNSMQREEAMRISQMFFDYGEEAIISDALKPCVKIVSEIRVPRRASRGLARVTLLAEEVISQQFAELKIGSDFNVNIGFEGTRAAGILVPQSYGGEDAVNVYRVTVDIEIY
jgi:hypothetical protein